MRARTKHVAFNDFFLNNDKFHPALNAKKTCQQKKLYSPKAAHTRMKTKNQNTSHWICLVCVESIGCRKPTAGLWYMQEWRNTSKFRQWFSYRIAITSSTHIYTYACRLSHTLQSSTVLQCSVTAQNVSRWKCESGDAHCFMQTRHYAMYIIHIYSYDCLLPPSVNTAIPHASHSDLHCMYMCLRSAAYK